MLWDLANGALLRTFALSSNRVSVACSPSGAHVLSSGEGKNLTMWDATTGMPLRS
jgi:hypothetical protein